MATAGAGRLPGLEELGAKQDGPADPARDGHLHILLATAGACKARQAGMNRRAIIGSVADALSGCFAGPLSRPPPHAVRGEEIDGRYFADAVFREGRTPWTPIVERLGALGRQDLHVIQRALDVVLPDLLGRS